MKGKGKGLSMKRALVLFWHGLKGIVTGIARWITVLLGMRDDSKYSMYLRRIVGTCFALMVVIFTVLVCCAIGSELHYRWNWKYNESNYQAHYLSQDVAYCKRPYHADGYVRRVDGKKTIKDVNWMEMPLGEDSLVCYSKGRKRGYFNLFTGEPVIKPQYDHAWIFSEGLAAVDDNGRVKFIDATGKVTLDLGVPYQPDVEGYVFHNGYCAVHDKDHVDKMGMIDKQGNWVVQPEYESISHQYSSWILDDGERQSVLDENLQTIIAPLKGDIVAMFDSFKVTLSDSHAIQSYDLQGELTEPCFISEVSNLIYVTDELQYATRNVYNPDGVPVGETRYDVQEPVEAVAKCRRYQSAEACYGLLTAEGKIITPPLYAEITAIGYDTYLCMTDYEEGVILNGKGERVE